MWKVKEKWDVWIYKEVVNIYKTKLEKTGDY